MFLFQANLEMWSLLQADLEVLTRRCCFCCGLTQEVLFLFQADLELLFPLQVDQEVLFLFQAVLLQPDPRLLFLFQTNWKCFCSRLTRRC